MGIVKNQVLCRVVAICCCFNSFEQFHVIPIPRVSQLQPQSQGYRMFYTGFKKHMDLS